MMGASMLPFLAQAQDAGAGSLESPVAADADYDDIIVVTAQRRSQDVLKVPLSVTVLGEDTLNKRGVSDLADVTKLAPSLQMAQDNTFSVRGIGTGTFANTVESSVSQVVDDVVLGYREFASNAFYDVARVEVLNGPQGLLFGKNASAGLVNITTNRPELGEYSLAADAQVVQRARPDDNGTGYRVRSTLNVPIGENAAARLNVIYADDDPVTSPMVNPAVRNDLSRKNFGLRGKLLFEPNDALSVYIAGDVNTMSGITTRYDVTFREFGPDSQYPARGLQDGEVNLLYLTESPNYRDSDTGGLQANISYALGNGMELTSVSAWKTAHTDFQFDSDNTPFNFFSFNGSEGDYDQYSQELRLALPSDNRITGQAGVYFFQSDSSATGYRGGNQGLPAAVTGGFPFCIDVTPTAGPPPACNVNNTSFLGQDFEYDLSNTSYAAFSQLGYDLTDTLKLTAGARLTREEAEINLSENFGDYFVTLGVPRNVSNQSVEATDLSYKLGADWQASPDLLVYGFYAEGFKGPGFSNTSPAPNADLSVDPEISRGGEVGMKGRAFDGALTFSASAFHTKFSDLQVQAWLQQLRTFVLSNAATATTQGIDLSFQARPTQGLTLSGSASIVDATFNDYPGAQCYATQTSNGCNTAVDSSDPAYVGTFNAAGFDVPLSAGFTGTFGADYVFPISNVLDADLGASYYHRSSQSSGIGEPFTIPAWDTIDLRAGMSSDTWSLSLFCKNCTNSVRPISIGGDAGDSNNGELTLSQRFGFNSVRTVGLRASTEF